MYGIQRTLHIIPVLWFLQLILQCLRVCKKIKEFQHISYIQKFYAYVYIHILIECVTLSYHSIISCFVTAVHTISSGKNIFSIIESSAVSHAPPAGSEMQVSLHDMRRNVAELRLQLHKMKQLQVGDNLCLLHLCYDFILSFYSFAFVKLSYPEGNRLNLACDAHIFI